MGFLEGIRTVECWFSGGRDSAISCFFAKRFADMRGLDFRLMFIDTTIGLRDTIEFVHRYAKWLGVDLTVLRPRHTFEELLMRYRMWPTIYPPTLRWCYHMLKSMPLYEHLSRHRHELGSILWVLGIRLSESVFRLKGYGKTDVWTTSCVKQYCVRTWLPLLKVPDNWISHMLDILVRRFGMPTNPVWSKLGVSGECLCLAGAGRGLLDRLIIHYPEVALRLAELDRRVNELRAREGREPSYAPPLKKLRITVSDYVTSKMRQKTLLDFTEEYVGKSCEACFPIGEGTSRQLG